jgi:hypothetical protein
MPERVVVTINGRQLEVIEGTVIASSNAAGERSVPSLSLRGAAKPYAARESALSAGRS